MDEASALEGGPPLSFFEVMTGLAYAAFADAPVDVAVVEVGMGGRWDATNVADARVAVIGPVGLDHTGYLGDTLAAIAGEKAGIIKPAGQVVLAAQEHEAAEVLLAAALQLEAPTVMEDLHFGVTERVLAVGGQVLTLRGLGGDYREVFLPLFGAHQARNAALALAAVEAFFGVEPDPLLAGPTPLRIPADEQAGTAQPSRAHQPVPEIATDVPLASPRRQLDPLVVHAGFAAVRSPGRLEVVRRAPTVVVDACHNPHGAVAVAEALTESFSFTRTVAVLGILAEKDARGNLTALAPAVDEVIVTRSSSPRQLPVESSRRSLPRSSETIGSSPWSASTSAGASRRAGRDRIPAGVGGGVLVTGSITVVGEARLAGRRVRQ